MKPIVKDGHLNISNLFNFIVLHFWNWLKFSVFFVLIFSVYFFIKTPTYSSQISFYTNYQNVNNSSLLSPFLTNIAGLDNEGLLNFSVSEFLSSDKFFHDIVVKNYSINGDKKTLVDYWGDNYNNYFHFNPLNFLKTINRNIMFSKDLSEYDKKIAHAKKVLESKISFSEDRRSGLNTISVNTKKYPNLSQEIIENIYLSLLSYSNEINSIKAEEKIIFISGRIDEVKINLKQSEDKMIAFLVQNKNLQSPLLLLEKDRIQREINLYSSLYLSLSDQLELAKIDEKDNTSSVFLLDSAHKNTFKYGFSFLTNIFGVFIFTFVFLFCINCYRERKQLFLF